METKQQSKSQERDQQPSIQLSLNDINLIPFSEVNGEWTVPDKFLRVLFANIILEGKFESVFFEGLIRSDDDFISMLKSPGNVPVLITHGIDKMLGIAWMNALQGNLAFGHFCFLDDAIESKLTVECGKRVISYWLSFPTLEVIVGVIPSFNQPAIKYVERIGFEKIGSIKNMVRSAYLDGRFDAVLFYQSRIED